MSTNLTDRSKQQTELKAFIEACIAGLKQPGLSNTGAGGTRTVLFAGRAFLSLGSVDDYINGNLKFSPDLWPVLASYFKAKGFSTRVGAVTGSDRVILEVTRPEFAMEGEIEPLQDLELDADLLASIPSVAELEAIENSNRARERVLETERLNDLRRAQLHPSQSAYSGQVRASWAVLNVKRALQSLAFQCDVQIAFDTARDLVGRTIAFRVKGATDAVATFQRTVESW